MSKWSPKYLSEVIERPISGSRPSGGVNSEIDGIPSLGGENVLSDGGMTYRNLNKVPVDFYRFMPKGHLQALDVLINKDGAQTGKVGIYQGEFSEACINEHLFILRNKAGAIDQRFLYYSILLPETQLKIARRITGSAQPGLNSTFVNAVDILVPLEPGQQVLIAEILTTLDQFIEQTEALIQKYQQIKTGLLHDLFTRGFTPDGKLRSTRVEAPHLYKDSLLGWIPKEWECNTGEELLKNKIFNEIQDGNHGELHPKSKDFVEEGIPFIMAADIAEGTIDFENCKKIPNEIYQKLRIGFAKPQDVLLSHKASIGFVAIVPDEITELMLTPQVTYYRISNKEKLLFSYLYYYMQSIRFQGSIKRLAKQSTRDYIGIIAQRNLRFLFPNQIQEQKQIIESLEFIDKLIINTKIELKKLQRIKIGLMRDLLTGKVPVNVPNTFEAMA